jgi:hypothetical protein
MRESHVARANTTRLMYDATKASHSSTLRRGVSSSFSRANKALRFVTPKILHLHLRYSGLYYMPNEEEERITKYKVNEG